MAKPKISILMLLPPLIFAGLAALFFFGMERDDPDALPSTRIGQAAPPLTVSAFADAAGFTDETLREPGVKLVNFWASWCAPCRAEHPNLEKMAADGITIYGINYKDDPAKAQRFLDELGSPFAALMADAKGRTALDWGTYGVPETFVIDGDGKVRFRYAGPIVGDVLDRIIRPEMEKAAR